MIALSVLTGLCVQAPQSDVDFDRDVRPILAERCFACHGPDAASRASDLRLDTREGATADLGGYAAIVPGDPARSELWRRVTAAAADDRMPPADSHKDALDEAELRIIKAWIEADAPWAQHWAFVAPTRPDVPAGSGHPVDRLMAETLRRNGFTMAPHAPVHTLALRLSMDLTGLPPTPEDMAALGAAPSDQEWAAWVDGLLASASHAERMAMWWLDGARYADTDGFQQDATRSNWPWRDWVVEAFRTNMRFDRFTELQFAGDLGDSPSADAVLATCFHRNHMHNGEGGRDPEESRVDYVRDRVNTVGAVWLGLTLECAQCHDHKFDPISQADYYSLTAYFNSIDESGQAGGGAKPFLPYTSARAARGAEEARAELAAARKAQAELRESFAAPFAAWLAQACATIEDRPVGWVDAEVVAATSVEGGVLSVGGGQEVRRSGAATDKEEYTITLAAPAIDQLTGLEVSFPRAEDGSFSDATDGEFILTGVKVTVVDRDAGTVNHGTWRSALANAQGQGVDSEVRAVQGALNDDPRQGWTTRGTALNGAARAVFALESPLAVWPTDTVEVKLLFRSSIDGAYARRVRLRLTEEAGDATRVLGPTPRAELAGFLRGGGDSSAVEGALRDRLFEQFLDGELRWRQFSYRTRRLEAQLKAAEASRGEVQVTVLRERPTPRETFVLLRGEWDQHGAPVAPGTPGGIWNTGPVGAADRRQLANWITDADNPLTARVIVNQLWQLLFGQGLVRTPSDFGIQGERPVHQPVLDWLSVEFIESGWDVRHVLRTIAATAAYRQSSKATPEQLRLDPNNRWLARGARFRLPSWMIRDRALAVSGLLDRRLGGPPVFPHQPAGVWEEMFMGRMRYQPTVGQSRHRRSLYAFWRRNVAPTFFFDSADRRSCAVDVRQTNTPLQALTVLNDRTFVEAARSLALAARAVGGGGDGAAEPVAAQLAAMAYSVLLRPLRPPEAKALAQVYASALAIYRADSAAAAVVVAPPELDAVPLSAGGDAATTAALTAVATVILNLDEVLTRG